MSPGATPRRGEVWWVRLDPTLGSEIEKTRPCLVLTTDVANVSWVLWCQRLRFKTGIHCLLAGCGRLAGPQTDAACNDCGGNPSDNMCGQGNQAEAVNKGTARLPSLFGDKHHASGGMLSP